uniref:Uncharacterized protein n=1 Tax=Candidatus Methanogaster sp. ANME-2c ERB4 TaxID=2759911 RepID=A0A7G9YNW6_9EURY|nr:hypothetical protein BFOKDAJI_00001 [Methanosarcinales archaeon ANME-2c ERB4]
MTGISNVFVFATKCLAPLLVTVCVRLYEPCITVWIIRSDTSYYKIASIRCLRDRVSIVTIFSPECPVPLLIAICINLDEPYITTARAIRGCHACKYVATVRGLHSRVSYISHHVMFPFPSKCPVPLLLTVCVRLNKPEIINRRPIRGCHARKYKTTVRCLLNRVSTVRLRSPECPVPLFRWGCIRKCSDVGCETFWLADDRTVGILVKRFENDNHRFGTKKYSYYRRLYNCIFYIIYSFIII